MSMKMNRSIAVVALVALASLILGLACNGGAPEEREFALEIEHRALKGETVLQTRQGDTVTFNMTADEEGSLHLHGYDLEEDLTPGQSATLQFVADATGSFAFTMHVGGGDGGHSHGAVLESGIIEAGQTFAFSVPHHMEEQAIPYHSHLYPEASGHIMVDASASSSRVEVTIENKAFSPDHIMVAPGTEIVWNNNDSVSHMLASGEHPGASQGDDGGEEEEVELGRLEVLPR